MRKAAAAAVGVLALVHTSCAAIVAPRTTPIYVTSEPAGAEVRVNGFLAGRTPATVDVDTRRPEAIVVSKAGHGSQACRIRTSSAAGYIVGDTAWCVLLFPLGCLAFAFDGGGAWDTPDDKTCSVMLEQPSGSDAHQQAARDSQ